jgi:hypothetical protein
VDPFFAWVEGSALSIWLRESESLLAFPGVLTVHALGLAFAVGTSVAVDLRLLGFLPGVPLAAMARFLPVFWAGLAANVVSGVLLLIAYPTKALTNPIFLVKMLCIGGAVAILLVVRRAVLTAPQPGRRGTGLAVASLGLWFGAIASGRLLAYTYSRLLVGF